MQRDSKPNMTIPLRFRPSALFHFFFLSNLKNYWWWMLMRQKSEYFDMSCSSLEIQHSYNKKRDEKDEKTNIFNGSNSLCNYVDTGTVKSDFSHKSGRSLFWQFEIQGLMKVRNSWQPQCARRQPQASVNNSTDRGFSLASWSITNLIYKVVYIALKCK